IAEGVGGGRVASMVALGAYIEATGVVSLNSAIACLNKIVTEKYREFLHLDEEALKQGATFVMRHSECRVRS
ncbi:MAG: hypothetical protein ACK4WF_09220, partial [Candidatus Brocadiales bacterium]